MQYITTKHIMRDSIVNSQNTTSQSQTRYGSVIELAYEPWHGRRLNAPSKSRHQFTYCTKNLSIEQEFFKHADAINNEFMTYMQHNKYEHPKRIFGLWCHGEENFQAQSKHIFNLHNELHITPEAQNNTIQSSACHLLVRTITQETDSYQRTKK